MININLYQAGKVNISLDFPANWNDLFPDEVVFISKTLLQQNEINAVHTRPKILKYIIESRAKFENKKLPSNWMVVVDAEDMVKEGYPLIDFIFTKNELTNLPAPVQFNKWFGQTYYPVPFGDMTCGEFEDSEVFTNTFFSDPGPESLAGLMSVLFRPKKANQIVPYMEFNFKNNQYKTYDHAKHQKHFLKLRPEVLYSIFVWYTGCRSQLSFMFPTVYSGGENGPTDPLAFTNCIHSGAGPKNGSRNQIRVMKVYEFMYDMEQEALKAEQLKEEYERLRIAR